MSGSTLKLFGRFACAAVYLAGLEGLGVPKGGEIGSLFAFGSKEKRKAKKAAPFRTRMQVHVKDQVMKWLPSEWKKLVDDRTPRDDIWDKLHKNAKTHFTDPARSDETFDEAFLPSASTLRKYVSVGRKGTSGLRDYPKILVGTNRSFKGDDGESFSLTEAEAEELAKRARELHMQYKEAPYGNLMRSIIEQLRADSRFKGKVPTESTVQNWISKPVANKKGSSAAEEESKKEESAQGSPPMKQDGSAQVGLEMKDNESAQEGLAMKDNESAQVDRAIENKQSAEEDHQKESLERINADRLEVDLRKFLGTKTVPGASQKMLRFLSAMDRRLRLKGR